MGINDRIMELRKCLNMSRRSFGEALGVSGDVISNIEYNRLARPDQKEPIYMLICEKFRVNEEWLRNGIGEMFVPKSRGEKIAEFAADVIKEDVTFRRRLVEALSDLTTEEWALLESISKKLSEEKD